MKGIVFAYMLSKNKQHYTYVKLRCVLVTEKPTFSKICGVTHD